MAAGERLDAVETTFLAAFGGGAVGLDHAGDVVLVHLLREAAVQRFADRRRRDRRQPVRGVGLAAPPQVRDLAHDRGAVRVHALGELLQMRDHLVDADVQLPEDVGAVRRDVRRAAEHGERQTALRLFSVIELIALGRHAVLFETAGMARAHDSIAQRQVPDRQRHQQWVGTAGCWLGDCCFRSSHAGRLAGLYLRKLCRAGRALRNHRSPPELQHSPANWCEYDCGNASAPVRRQQERGPPLQPQVLHEASRGHLRVA